MNNVSDRGLAFTRNEEGGARNQAYQDIGGVWTIGVGHTGPEVVEGLVWTDDQCEAQYEDDGGKVDDAIGQINCDPPLKQNEKDALFDFGFNEGVSALLHSTLVAHIESGGDIKGLYELWDKVREDGVLVTSK